MLRKNMKKLQTLCLNQYLMKIILKNGDNGSGMHVSISLWTKSSSKNVNLFYDENDDYADLVKLDVIL